jgi:RNA polymerase sigma-54 factor
MQVAMRCVPSQRFATRPAHAQLVTFAATLALDGAGLDALVEAELAAEPALERDVTGRAWAQGPLQEVTVVAPTSARQMLETDLAASLPTGERHLATVLVAELDDRGFLDASPVELALRSGVAIDRVRSAIDMLRALGPVGLGTDGPISCIMAQLADADIPASIYRLARVILQDHLQAAADGNIRRIASDLDVDVNSVRACITAIRQHTRPTPCWDGAITAPVQPPDLVVTDDAGLDVHLLERSRHRLRVAPSYVGLSVENANVVRAQGFLERLEQRWRTLERIGYHVIDRQAAFVRDRSALLNDLTRASIASDLGLHASTVSRAVAHRVIALPDGRTMPLTDFFSSGAAVRRALEGLLARESAPCSDAELTRQLVAMGFGVARRTVAKYRAELGVERAAPAVRGRVCPAKPRSVKLGGDEPRFA